MGNKIFLREILKILVYFWLLIVLNRKMQYIGNNIKKYRFPTSALIICEIASAFPKCPKYVQNANGTKNKHFNISFVDICL